MTALGIGTYTFTWAVGVPGYPVAAPLDGFGLLQKAAALGVALVQIADNLPLHTLPPQQLAALLAEAGRLGIGIEVGTRGIAPDHLNTYLEIACRCASPILRVVIDTQDHHPAPAEVVDTLRDMVPAFAGANVTLAIENHDRFKAATLARVIEDIGSPYVGICLDTVNSFGALEGPEIVVEALGPYVANLHLKEFVVRRADHHMGFVVEGAPAGRGMLNVPWLLEKLHGFGRSFNAIVELWTPPETTVEATIAKEAIWAEASIAYLRTLIRG